MQKPKINCNGNFKAAETKLFSLRIVNYIAQMFCTGNLVMRIHYWIWYIIFSCLILKFKNRYSEKIKVPQTYVNVVQATGTIKVGFHHKKRSWWNDDFILEKWKIRYNRIDLDGQATVLLQNMSFRPKKTPMLII